MLQDPGSLVSSLAWWHRVLIAVGLAILVAYGVAYIGRWIVGRLTGDDPTVGRILLEELRVAIARTIVLVALTSTAELIPRASFLVGALAATALVAQWCWTSSRIGSRTINSVTPGGPHADFAPIVRNVWSLGMVAIGFFVVLTIWNVDVTPLLASAGIIGIVVAVAAQGTIGNVFAGIALSFDHTYRVGDVLTLASGQRGRVTDVSIRSTTLVTRDRVEVTIPNTNLNQEQIINESAPERPRRIRVPVGVAYDSDLDRVERTIRSAARDVDTVLDSPRPEIRYRAFGDSAIELEMLCHIRNPSLRGRAVDDLVRRIHTSFTEEGITIPFPQRELSYLSRDEREGEAPMHERGVGEP